MNAQVVKRFLSLNKLYGYIEITDRDEQVILSRLDSNASYGDLAERFDISRARAEQIFKHKMYHIGHWVCALMEMGAEAKVNETLQKELNETREKLERAVKLSQENALHDEPITSPMFDFGVRAINCLTQHKITTIGTLVELSELDLMKMRGMGRLTAYHIKNDLMRNGLSLLKTDVE